MKSIFSALLHLHAKRHDKACRKVLIEELRQAIDKAGRFNGQAEEVGLNFSPVPRIAFIFQDAHEFYVFMLERIQEEVRVLMVETGHEETPDDWVSDYFNFHW